MFLTPLYELQFRRLVCSLLKHREPIAIMQGISIVWVCSRCGEAQ